MGVKSLLFSGAALATTAFAQQSAYGQCKLYMAFASTLQLTSILRRRPKLGSYKDHMCVRLCLVSSKIPNTLPIVLLSMRSSRYIYFVELLTIKLLPNTKRFYWKTHANWDFDTQHLCK